MDLTRLKFLAGAPLEEGANLYAEPKADHKVDSKSTTTSHANGKDLKDKPEMDMVHHKTSEKTGDQSANYAKDSKSTSKAHAKGKDIKDKAEMDATNPKGGKGNTDEPKANHAVKSFATDKAHASGKEVHVKEWAEAIVESGDVEGSIKALLAALEDAGVQL